MKKLQRTSSSYVTYPYAHLISMCLGTNTCAFSPIQSQVLSTFYSKGQCEVVGEEAFNGWMYLYQANIPLSLLDMFDNPKYAPSTPPSVSVQVITIRYSPLATLRARLLELMVPEKLVSETYGLSARGQKRKYDGQGSTQPAPRETLAGENACSSSCVHILKQP